MIRPLTPRTKLIMLTGALAVSAQALAATPAGTPITNRAVATYDPVEGVGRSDSNVVITTVQAQCAVSLSPSGTPEQPGRAAGVLAGERAVFSYTIVNAGNDTFTFTPRPEALAGAALSAGLQVYRDLNRNGQLDQGEPAVTSVELAAEASAALLLVVDTAAGTSGDLLVGLSASCGGGEGASSVAKVVVGQPPRLDVQKSFSPALIRPGLPTTVTVTVSNNTSQESREVLLTDLLTEQVARGLRLSSAASASQGTVEYTTDGTTWSAALPTPAQVLGVRARIARLAPGEQATLSFKMTAEERADGQSFTNVATARTSGQETSGTAVADVRYQPAVALGPVGNPGAPEGGPEDRQSRPFAVVGQSVCFDHTLQNTGDVADAFRITVTFPQGAAEVSVQGPSGSPLAQPLTLQPGQQTVVRVCYVPTQAGPLEALITASGDRGTTNQTRDLLDQVEAGLPELRKSVQASSLNADNQPVVLPEGATVAAGDTLTYTLVARNPYTRPLSGVLICDPLPAHLDFVSASEGGVLSGAVDAQVVTWNLGTLAPGESRSLTVQAKVSARAVDGEGLKNIFNLVSTEFTQPVSSNEVNTPVWSAALEIQKQSAVQLVTYGDRIRYTLRLRNTSQTTSVINALITDTPSQGLEYIPGTSTLDGTALADPVITGGSLNWTIPELRPNVDVLITYELRVTPDAPANGQLDNVVQAVGTGAGGVARAIASNRAQAAVKVDPLKFAALSDILGTVFVDRNRNGLYDLGSDTPIERARVILSNGRQVITDAQGRYKFSNVPFGTWALRLDPNTTPYQPLHTPQDGGQPGTRTAQVRGLTTLDIPLAPLGGDISALRRTTLTVGATRVEKAVYADQSGGLYTVTLKLSSPEALSDFELTDPLPAGAVLKEGRNTWQGTLPSGETTLTYRFQWGGDVRGATTDPVVTWRY